MDNGQRITVYQRQNGTRRLTPRQQRRIVKAARRQELRNPGVDYDWRNHHA